MKHLLPLSLLFLCLAAVGQDAAMFRSNLQHTGVYEAAGIPKFSKVKWKFHTAGQIISSPAVANGMVYVGSTDHHLYAIDQDSGVEKWNVKTGDRVTSSPTVSAGIVYFESYDGNLYAVDGATGTVKWKFQTGG